MGLDINAVQFLISARKNGAQFGDVLMIGRQDLNVFPAKVHSALTKHGVPADAFAPNAADTRYAEPVFQALGARNVYALDASNFEGAQFVHDLNEPVPTELRERFDLVYDGGTLEHVFNFPQALKNCMEMVKAGGCFITHTPGNNWLGHGFYQFSPELFYRALSHENGFEVQRMVAHVVGPYGRWFEVTDPEAIQARVEAYTFLPLHLFVQARRRAVVPMFAQWPQQSDYTPRWKPVEAPAASRWGAVRPKLARTFPGIARLGNVIRIGLRMFFQQSMRNRRNFRPVPRP